MFYLYIFCGFFSVFFLRLYTFSFVLVVFVIAPGIILLLNICQIIAIPLIIFILVERFLDVMMSGVQLKSGQCGSYVLKPRILI